jgi:cell division transport system ATP-binding protein
MIELQHVSKRYANGNLAVDDVNLHLARGELAFLTGPAGSGKSTLLKLIAAIEPSSQGQITVANQMIHELTPRRIPFLRRQIGLILQTPHLLMDRSVFDNVALPLVISGCSSKETNSRVRAVLTKVGLSSQANHYPHALSNGEQQRVAIARALVNKPPLLLADEPTGNLDPALASEIMQVLEQFNRLGMTILIATHHLNLINNPKHKQFALAKGKLIYA